MSVTLFPKQSNYYFAFKRIWILADDPDLSEKLKNSPDLPVINKVALDIICDLTQSKATAEAKVELLKKAIESL